MSSGEPPSMDCSGEGSLNLQDLWNKIQHIKSKLFIEQHKPQKGDTFQSMLLSMQQDMYAVIQLEKAKIKENQQAELNCAKRKREEAIKASQRKKDEELAAERVTEEEIERWEKEARERQGKLTALQSTLVELGLGQPGVVSSSSSNNPPNPWISSSLADDNPVLSREPGLPLASSSSLAACPSNEPMQLSPPAYCPASSQEDDPLPPQKRAQKRAQCDATSFNNAPTSKKAKPTPVKEVAQSPKNVSITVSSKDIEILHMRDVLHSDTPTTLELQSAPCIAGQYKGEGKSYSKCISCTKRTAGNVRCRFQNMRYFVHNKEGHIIGITFPNTARKDELEIELPVTWNVRLERTHTLKIKIAIARMLLPILEAELQHLGSKDSIYKSRESDARTTCDTCLTSLFSGTWLCRFCGREACAECFLKVKELTRPDTMDEQKSTAREDKTEQTPVECNGQSAHDFMPMSRFTEAQLHQAINDMSKLLQRVMAINRDKLYFSRPHNFTDVGTIPSHPIGVFSSSSITEYAFFDIFLNGGEPLIVTDLLSKSKLVWTPEYFIKHYGGHSCTLVECHIEKDKKCLVEDFFKRFGKYAERQRCWELRDWSPTRDFKSAFPALYDDFISTLPLPEYVRPDGVLNIASHFPPSIIPPELGPVIHSAMASTTAPGSKGSVKLQMNMADTVNVMTFSSPKSDGTEGCAAWDIFRSEDSDKIRSYVRSKASQYASSTSASKGHQPITSNATSTKEDPIHSEQIYLDDELRNELWSTTGVKSYRFYQKPGEAVFVPVGCAYQVCNLADCINVVIKFVSPDSIERCEQVTREFREQAKKDTLQLKTAMWFAWTSCTEVEFVGFRF